MLNLRLEEIVVVIFFTVLHLSFYQHFSHLPAEKHPVQPLLIEFIQLKPKPPEPKLEQPKPKLQEAPPKLKQPVKQPPKKVKPEKIVKKSEPEKVVEKPRLQQESLIKVHAEEVVVKTVVEHPQQLNAPVVNKPDNKAEEKAVTAEEPVHESVVTKAGYGGSCRSALSRYPAEAKEQGIEGTVKVKVQVLADGSVGNVEISKSSGSDILDNSVLEHVKDCDFDPAEKDGVPFASKVIIPVKFKLGAD